MIFTKAEDGTIFYIGGKLPNGGFYFMYGTRTIRLSKEDCARLVAILGNHLAEESGELELVKKREKEP